MTDMNKMLESPEIAGPGRIITPLSRKQGCCYYEGPETDCSSTIWTCLPSLLREVIQYKLLRLSTPTTNGYRGQLAAVLAPNFRCKAIYMGTSIHFFGREGDVDTCVGVFIYLYKIMRTNGYDRSALLGKRATVHTASANCYWPRFMRGLQDELGAQSKALAIIVP